MPADLAAVYQELWQEVVWLASSWEDFKRLYRPDVIDLLNETAGTFFRDEQQRQRDDVMMQLCRVTDPLKSAGKPTLTIKRLPDVVEDAALQAKVQGLVDAADTATEFARQWRNRRIAHTELPASITGAPVTPLPRAATQDIDNAVSAVVAVVDTLSLHFADMTTGYGELGKSARGGVDALLYFLKAGREAEQERLAKIRRMSDG